VVVLLFGEKGNKSENSRWDFISSFSSFFLFALPAIFEIHSLAQSNKQTSNSSMGGNKGGGKGKARVIVEEEEEEDILEEKMTPSPQPSKIAAATKTKGKRTRHEIMSPSSPAHSNSKSQQSSDYAQLLQPIRFLFFSSFFFFLF